LAIPPLRNYGCSILIGTVLWANRLICIVRSPFMRGWEDTLYTTDMKADVSRLVEEFEAHVPREWVIDYLQDRLGAESVQEMEDGKIRVLFYDRELTKNKVGNTRKFLRAFERHVDEYLLQKGIRLYKGRGNNGRRN